MGVGLFLMSEVPLCQSPAAAAEAINKHSLHVLVNLNGYTNGGRCASRSLHLENPPYTRYPTPHTLHPSPTTLQPTPETRPVGSTQQSARLPSRHLRSRREREFFIDNLLIRIHFIIVMIRWTGLAPWEFEFYCVWTDWRCTRCGPRRSK